MTFFFIFLPIKLGIFCNFFFDPRNLLPSTARFYKFTSENVRRILIYTKDQVHFFLKVAKLCDILSRGLLWLKNMRTSIPCKRRHFWKRFIGIRCLTFIPSHFAGVGESARHQLRWIISRLASWDALSRSSKQISFEENAGMLSRRSKQGRPAIKWKSNNEN